MFTRTLMGKVCIALFVLLAMCGMVAAGTVTHNITYQGKLTDASGNPLTGSYPVVFSLYDGASGGTALAADSHSVTAANGLFTTTITFDSSLYDGRGLWLGTKVGSDPEMTPLQEIRPVPYALAALGTEKKPVRYEYYTAPMFTLKTLGSLQDYTTVTNAGDTPASVCYTKYLKQGIGDFIQRVSQCITLGAGKTQTCTPTQVANSTYQWRIKITTNSSYVVPYTCLIEGSGPDQSVVYLPGDFQKVEIYE